MRGRTKAWPTLTSVACVLFCAVWLCPAAQEGEMGKRFLHFPLLQQADRTDSGTTTQDSAPQSKQLSMEERADIFMARKNYADAVDYYSRALRQSRQSAVLWNKIGIAYQQQMNFTAARKAYK